MQGGQAVALHVSIHAPARGATRHAQDGGLLFVVSIHAPARGATLNARLGKRFWMFQSTRPRGARPKKSPEAQKQFEVSIHAPARGATRRPVGIRYSTTRFQSTRPRGARRASRRKQQHNTTFQSTRPRGARPDIFEFVRCKVIVSIHAPARGATSYYRPVSQRESCFNPRAREGRDQLEFGAADRRDGFNPRAREGRDV